MNRELNQINIYIYSSSPVTRDLPVKSLITLYWATFTLQAETTQFRFFCPYATCI